MDSTVEKIASIEKTRCVLVWKDGKVHYEVYRNSFKDSKEPINSITKTVVSLLLGIAVDRNHIESLNDRISWYVPGAKDTSILEHLTMTSGMDWGADLIKEECNGELIASSSWIDYICSKSILEHRRGAFKYNGGSSHLIGTAISNATGQKLKDFAVESLFSPLGISLEDDFRPMWYRLSNFSWTRRSGWDEDPEGNSIGPFGLSLCARDMLAIGRLILDKGSSEGKRILSESYVEEMTQPRVRAGHLHYGYHIWARKIRGVRTASALGYGNQYLTVLPDDDAVIVMLSENDGTESPELEKLHGELVKAVSRV